MYNNLSLSGGGNRGYCYIGVMKALEKYPEIMHNIKNISGASIGSFFATVVGMGINHKELIPFINADIQLNDINIDNLFNEFGFSQCEEIIDNFKKVISLRHSPNITFKELHIITKKNLYITASCLNTCKIVYFNHTDNPDMKIIDAIRYSITIPFVFTSKKYNDQYYVDGAIFEKLPLQKFNNTDKTLGLLLTVIDEEILPNNINCIEDFAFNLLLFLKIKINSNEINNNVDIVKIRTEFSSPMNFNLDKNTKIKYIKAGYNSLINFIVKNKIDIYHIYIIQTNNDYNNDDHDERLPNEYTQRLR